jgi:ATP-binding cassette, subfamily B, bacterial
VPVRRQFTVAECGAACLAMIVSAFGRRTTTAECREVLRTSRDGTDALSIVRAARGYGLRPRAFSVEPAGLGELPMPAIAHVDSRHFLVVERVSRRGVRVVDPEVGRHTLAHADFRDRFGGVAICFETTEAFERADGERTSVWRSPLLGALRTRQTVGAVLQILVASATIAVLGLAGPLATKIVVDEVLPDGSSDLMVVLGLGIAAVVLARLTMALLRGLLVVRLQAKLDAGLMLAFLRHVLSLPFRFFHDRSTGDLLMRLMSNTSIRDLLGTQSAQVVLDAVLVLSYAVILLAMAPGLGVVVVGFGALQLVVLGSTAAWMHRLMRHELQAQAESQSYLVEMLHGIAPVKASGAEQQAYDRWAALFSRHLRASVRRGRLSAVVSAVLGTVNTMGPVVVLAVGAVHVLDGRLSLGTMLAASALATSFLSPLVSLTSAAQQLQMLGATMERLGDVAAAEPEPRRGGAVPDASGRGTEVVLEDVTFRYGSEVPPILDGVSLRIRPGEKVALVGETGSGKSTVAKVLLGLLAPESGTVRYDGVPADRLDLVALRRRFGVVLQDAGLFAGTVRGNIAFADPGLPSPAVVRAARAAALHDEVERMPMGYETHVGEGGSAMSGGQRQRIALARALANEPSLLVLDEATSDLDVVTELEVNRNVSALRCTRVVIAHRLSTIRDADVIAVMRRGRIVECGTHDALLARDGHYTELIRHQVEGGDSEFADDGDATAGVDPRG